MFRFRVTLKSNRQPVNKRIECRNVPIALLICPSTKGTYARYMVCGILKRAEQAPVKTIQRGD
jgi:hypothetical protein